MSVVTSLMYAVAMVALLAIILECCCRRQLKRLQQRAPAPARHDVHDGIQVTLRNVQINIPYVVASSQGGAAYYPAPAPAPAVYYPPPLALPTGAVPAFGLNSHLGTPPPTYEQVMAADRAPGPQQPG